MPDSPENQEPPGAAPPRFAPPSKLEMRRGANLPHWRKEGATYSVTFRLANSLPAHVLQSWITEREHTVLRAEAMGRPLSAHENTRLAALHSERVEEWLDQGHGSCSLQVQRIGQLVADALAHFDGERYDLIAWCVMPNHVHAVLRMKPNHDLSATLQSWKGFTGKKAREILGSAGDGAFWQKESYDRIVRDQEEFAHHIRYVIGNPAAAGLLNWPWVGRGKGSHK